MNGACRNWHAAYNTAAIAVGMGTAALMGIVASEPNATHSTLFYSNLKLEMSVKFSIKVE